MSMTKKTIRVFLLTLLICSMSSCWEDDIMPEEQPSQPESSISLLQDGKWQPYGDVQKIVLRRMINPCPLVDTVKWISVPRTNEWLRFDMRIGDFVHPYGTGTKSDFEVKVEWDGLSASQCRLCTATVRFVAEKCGGYFTLH